MNPEIPAATQASAAANAPSIGLTILAALSAIFVPLMVVAVLVLSVRGLAAAFQMAGWGVYLVVLAAMGSWCVCVVLAVLAARSIRIPSAIPIFLATLPWIAGLVGLSTGMLAASGAIAFADSASQSVMSARGYSEALQSRVFGGWATAGLAASLSLAFAFGAAGQRDTNRKWSFAGVGAVFALLLVGLSGYALVAHSNTAGAVMVAFCAACALVSLPVALGASGGDARHSRAAALSAASVVAMLLAWGAASVAAISHARADQFLALSIADPESRMMFAARSASSFLVLARVHWIGMGVMVACVLVCLGWSASRAKPTLGGVVGAAFVAIFVALPVAVDVGATAQAEAVVMTFTEDPWEAVPGFQPVVFPIEVASGYDGRNILGVDGLVFQQTTVSTTDLLTAEGQAQATELFRAQQAARNAGWLGEGELPDWLGEDELPDWSGEDERPQWEEEGAEALGDTTERLLTEPRVSIFLDARVRVDVLRGVLRAAQAADIHALLLCGTTRQTDVPPGLDALTLRVLRPFPRGVTVLLDNALPAGFADADRTLWHTTVGASTRGAFSPRTGDETPPAAYPVSDFEEFNGEATVVAYLGLAPDASIDSIVAAALGANAHGFSPLLCGGILPGNPGQPITDEVDVSETNN